MRATAAKMRKFFTAKADPSRADVRVTDSWDVQGIILAATATQENVLRQQVEGLAGRIYTLVCDGSVVSDGLI